MRVSKIVMLFLVVLLALPPVAMADEQPMYTAVTKRNLSLRATESKEAEALAILAEGEKITIFSFSPQWVYVEGKAGIRGYILREYIDQVERINPGQTLPYGAVIHRYMAVVAEDTEIFTAPDFAADSYRPITAGSKISLISIVDGWAEVAHQRNRGYVHLSKLTGLTPAAPSAQEALPGDILATYTSYYKMTQDELNLGRMVNIDVSCEYISMVLQPGERFSFNAVAGPYRKAKGYMPAPVLIDGTTMPGYGGGTCQVSSTLYNVLLQLEEGITIVKRRPHGPGGAAYLPHGVDAAVGSDSIDLIFENAFAFPIRIDASAQDGALYISIYKA